MNSKIFIDIGAYNGDTIKEFMNWGKFIGNPSEYKIYAFEPNPAFATNFRKLNVEFSPKAAWIEDGKRLFAVDSTDTPMGSTLMSSKSAIWDHNPHIKVETFDFSTWLKQFEDDFVIVKMDTEGAEFPILNKMLEDDTVKICNYLMVEFHPNKVKEYTTTDKNNLIEALQQQTNLILWH